MNPVVVRHLSVPMPALAAPGSGLRIAHLSDLHLADWDRVIEGAQTHLLHLKYDLLAVTGDLIDGRCDIGAGVRLVRRFFEPLHCRYGTYAVLGNHDKRELCTYSDLNLTFLNDHAVTIRHSQVDFELAGVEQSQDNLGDVPGTLGLIAPGRPSVLLAHYPSTIYELPQGAVGLLLAGHTHGGQIRLPFLGCIHSADHIPPRLARGLGAVDGTRMHVSAGLGCSGPIQARFLCPPEITILTLKSTILAAEPPKNRLEDIGSAQGRIEANSATVV